MNLISIKVSAKVLDHIRTSISHNQEQIALKVVSGDLSYIIDTISKSRKVQLILAEQLVITLGDTSAIWKAHQEDVTDFDILFKMLSSKLDKEFVFSYKLSG
ncbi:Putative uncharacterized protein [Moritella viscosa]|uniref:hypothetical protein n=1 Tax=Moritella viscosa TaxID=80854 RepID=UPI000509030F|nr:hypothetical protein [Moritella viscosa]CED61484.1 putative uncharacterized protein [Moritella viscosa]SHO05524.1 Putative uncharacterized protein [Moritella viscosa]SHO21446.1 Putative uncharacterized protein [Moritella viscosa]